MVEQELGEDVFSTWKYRNAVELLKQLSDLFLLGLIFNENTRPTYPNRFHDWVALLQVKHVIVKDALGSLDMELARLLILFNNNW